MKKLAILAILTAPISTAVYADAYANSHASEPSSSQSTLVYLSHPAYTFEVEGKALCFQPSANNTSYAVQAEPLPAPSPQWKVYEIDLDYHWGFDVGVKGIFHYTHSNLGLNWQHFHSSDSSSSPVLVASNMIGPFFEIGPDAAPYQSAYGRVSFDFNQANATYGIYLNLGDRLKTNLFGGVNFAYIKQDLYALYANTAGTIYRSIATPSRFKGAGPQIGIDFTYKLVKGLQIVGSASGSLFVGPQSTHTSYQSTAPELSGLGITPPNKQRTSVQRKVQTIPGLDGKLGVAYCAEFCSHYMISFEAGYEAQVYLNAIQSIDMGSEVNTPPVVPDTVGVFARTFKQTLSNFALSGPYMRLAFGF